MIAYITSLPLSEKQSLLEDLKAHILPPESPTTPNALPDVRFNTTTLLKSTLLNSALSETLRLQFNGLSVRGVSQHTSLRITQRGGQEEYRLEKGDVVFLALACVHKDI